jgi:REP element-mobilizing transposase RayT
MVGSNRVSEPRAVATGSAKSTSPMKRDYIDFNDRSSPVGYLITFRCYGTWLHGDERGSVDRHHRVYGAPGLPPSAPRRKHDRDLLKQPPVTLNSQQRAATQAAIRETCQIRRWHLWTVNVRTNHVHVVVSASKKPEALLSALKANATRAMREARLWTSELSPWEFRGSKKYLWNETQLADAIAYVEYDQGEPLD